MGKSFRQERNNYSENSSRNEFKRKKNKVKEDRFDEEFSEYKIHGFKKDKYQTN